MATYASLSRRNFLAGLAGAATSSVLAACGGGGSATSGGAPTPPTGAAPTSAAAAPTTAAGRAIELKYWSQLQPETQRWKDNQVVIDSFTQANPDINVATEHPAFADFDTKLVTAARARARAAGSSRSGARARSRTPPGSCWLTTTRLKTSHKKPPAQCPRAARRLTSSRSTIRGTSPTGTQCRTRGRRCRLWRPVPRSRRHSTHSSNRSMLLGQQTADQAGKAFAKDVNERILPKYVAASAGSGCACPEV